MEIISECPLSVSDEIDLVFEQIEILFVQRKTHPNLISSQNEKNQKRIHGIDVFRAQKPK